MAWVDMALLGILLLSIVVGVARGLVFEVMSLAGWVVAYVAAHALAATAAPHVPIGAPGSTVNLAASFVAVFFAVLLAWAIVSRIVRLVLHATPLSGPDRLLGAVFGGVRGVVVLLAIVTAVAMTPASRSAPWHASVAVPWLQAAASGLKPLLPGAISSYLPA